MKEGDQIGDLANADLDARAAKAFLTGDLSSPGSFNSPLRHQSIGPIQQSPVALFTRAESGPAQFATRLSSSPPAESRNEIGLPLAVITSWSDTLYELNYQAIAQFLQSKKQTKKNYLSSGSRCMFYSEKYGTLFSDSLSSFEFSQITEQYSTKLQDLLGSCPFWIDISDPSLEEMNSLSELFSIHPLTAEDIQTEETREKCEVFPHYYFITIKTFEQDQYSTGYLEPILFYLIVFKDCILSFHSRPVPHAKNVLKRIDQVASFGLSICSDWISYALIDDISDGFIPILRLIESEVDSIDELVLILKESEQSDMLRRIGYARKRVLLLMRLLSSKPDLLKSVIKRVGDLVSRANETTLYLGDILDHVITLSQNISHYEKTLARAHSNYLAQISIEITQSSNRTNDIAMKMTALASILIPLNVVTGLWGMNVKVPGQERDDYVWFYSIIAAMLIFATGTFWIVKDYYRLV